MHGISLILPVFNEEKCLLEELERCVASLIKTKLAYEIIIIDDKSTDNSLSIMTNYIEENKDLPIIIIKNKKNLGVGYSRKIGSEKAKYEIIIWTDVDLSYPNQDLDQIIDYFIKSNVDMTVGSRKTEEGTYKLIRFSVKFFIRKLAEFLSQEKIPDLNSGMRVFKKKIAKKYYKFMPDGFSCVSTLSLSFLTNKHDVNYYEINYKQRSGKSKFKFFVDTAKYIKQVIVICTTFNPLRIYLSIGFSLIFLAILISLFGIYLNFYIPNSSILFFLTGIVFIFMGAIADLISKNNKE